MPEAGPNSLGRALQAFFGQHMPLVRGASRHTVLAYRDGFKLLLRFLEAHIFLCQPAYYVEWHLRQALAPLLFQEEGLEAWQARRDPVAPAKPTPAAQAKKNRRVTSDTARYGSEEKCLRVTRRARA